MNWFIVVYFLVNGAWIEADKMGKEGWSPILQKDYYTCIEKINESNKRFQKIAEYREIELDIKFQCECKKNIENNEIINCKDRNWYQKIYDKLFLIK
tara:strand:+ start:306 stop:596 length:291 start_codon:yes stop_codon:yes gene_type:complete